jgi:hypothetical protein
MSRTTYAFPPLADRLAEGRPVLNREQITGLTTRIVDMCAAPRVEVIVRHDTRVVTRIAGNQVLSGDDGDTLTIQLTTGWERSSGYGSARMRINQIDDGILRSMVKQCESLAAERIRSSEEIHPVQPQIPDSLLPVHLWHEETIRAMQTVRSTVIPDLLSALPRDELIGA